MSLDFIRGISHSDKREITKSELRLFFQRDGLYARGEGSHKGWQGNAITGYFSVWESSGGQGEGLREATVEHFRQPYFIWEEKENYLQFQWQPIAGLIGATSAWKSVAMATPGGIIKNF